MFPSQRRVLLQQNLSERHGSMSEAFDKSSLYRQQKDGLMCEMSLQGNCMLEIGNISYDCPHENPFHLLI